MNNKNSKVIKSFCDMKTKQKQNIEKKKLEELMQLGTYVEQKIFQLANLTQLSTCQKV